MKLLELHINGFGKFHNRTISFQDGVNVIYGKNEAGKSTLHTFIRGILFGMERGRGRAARNDLYSKYEPWENSGSYEGWIRLEVNGTVYRIERKFQKDNRSLSLINETKGVAEEPTKALWDQILGGLNETTYNNTISIGQLKSATEEGMMGELKNYIANMNTTGNISLNITKASAFLRSQKRNLEANLIPDASKEYTALLAEIRAVDGEISSPEYENQLVSYQKMRTEVRGKIENTQSEKDALNEKIQKAKLILADNRFTDQLSVQAYQNTCDQYYQRYLEAEKECQKKSRTFLAAVSFLLALCGLGGAVYFGLSDPDRFLPISAACGAVFLLFLGIGIAALRRRNKYKALLGQMSSYLAEILGKHLGDPSISPGAIEAFRGRMAEFSRLCDMVEKSEETVKKFLEDINSLQEKQNSCSEMIEKQQKTQWELEKKLEHLGNCRNQAAALKRVLAENDRIYEEIAAIDLAQETMSDLSFSIRDSFGLYLNKEASRLVNGLTGGIYDSMSIDENLNVFLNTRTKLVPIENVSSGTMDQVYLALRLAAAKLLRGDGESYPLLFDDSFTQYDEDRLRRALGWLAKGYDGQMFIFTCHTREARILKDEGIDFHYIEI